MQPAPGPTNRDELRGQIRKLVIEHSGVDPRLLNNKTPIDDLGLDGVGVIGLMMAIEDTFDLEITETEVDALRDLQDIIDYVAVRLEI